MGDPLVARTLALVMITSAVLGVFASGASAQAENQWTSVLTCPNPPLVQPLGAPVQTTCNIQTQVSASVSNPVGIAAINIRATQFPSWVTITLSPTTVYFKFSQADQGPWEAPILVTMAAAAIAPAFTPASVLLSVDGTSPTQTVENVIPTTGNFQVTASYFNLYGVRLEQQIDKAGPQTVLTFPVTIDNLSNGPTRFDFLPVGEVQPARKGQFQLQYPPPLNLESTATGGSTTSGTAFLQVQTPFRNGYVNDVTTVQMLVKSQYAVPLSTADPASLRGPDTLVTVLAQGRGFYVPGFEALAGLLTIAGVAVVLRNRV